MTTFLKLWLILSLSVTIAACTDSQCVCVQDTKRNVYRDTFEFGVFDGGERYDQCGLYLVANLKRNRDSTGIFRPTQMPQEIVRTHRFSQYWGILEVLPEKSVCINNGPDPIPGREEIPDTMQFVNIVEFHIK